MTYYVHAMYLCFHTDDVHGTCSGYGTCCPPIPLLHRGGSIRCSPGRLLICTAPALFHLPSASKEWKNAVTCKLQDRPSLRRPPVLLSVLQLLRGAELAHQGADGGRWSGKAIWTFANTLSLRRSRWKHGGQGTPCPVVPGRKHDSQSPTIPHVYSAPK
jgi:hypothetical protein